MELTTSYQRLGQAHLGTDDYGGNLYIRIYAKYSEQDIQNNRSKVQYQARYYFTGGSIYDQQSSGYVKGTSANQKNFTKSNSYTYDEHTLETTEAWVTHNSDGTMSITASAYLKFPNWSWSGTAIGSATLPSLHKPPTIQTAEMAETDATMISLGVPNTTIVQYLSKKTITLHGTAEDSATLTYRLEHFGTNYNIPTTGYQASNVFNTDYTQNNITISTDNKANIVQKLKDSMNGETTDWVYVNINGVAQKPNGIAYAKPAIERTSTSIKRKSGGGVNLTDNKVLLNLKATFYKGNDVIGNNNLITQIGYKIWATDGTEPANYTTLTPTISGGNITITDFEISNIVFTNTYNYKIIITDNYGYSDTITDGRIPIGVSLWTEYKDHVDFLALSVKGSNPFEYSTSETICGVWNDGYNGKPIYRTVIEETSLPSSGEITTGLTDVDEWVNFRFVCIASNGDVFFDNFYQSSSSYIRNFLSTNDTNIRVRSGMAISSAKFILEYTKTNN